MSAVVFDAPTGLDALRTQELPTPQVSAGQVLVGIEAASINPVDIGTVSGAFGTGLPGEAPWVPGWDAAGTVLDVGDGVGEDLIGTTVVVFSGWFATGQGLQRSQAVVSRDQVAPVTADLTPAEVTSVGLTGLTALQGVAATGLGSGDHLAVAGATGEVGRLAVAIARHQGLEVTPVGRATSEAELADVGADALFDAATADSRWLAAVRDGGKVVSVVGPIDEERGITVTGFGVFVSREDLATLAGLIDSGVVTPHVGPVLPAEDPTRAYVAFTEQSDHARVVLSF